MSRAIPPKNSVTLTDSERGLRDTEGGKLIFTEYRGRKCALLLRGGRVIAASFFSGISGSNIGAVYIGRVKNVAKNIDACFVEISGREVCFLPLKKASAPLLTNRAYDGRLLAGDQVLVQVERDAQKTKQASVTAHISLSNDYFAMTFGNPRVGFSAKLDKKCRDDILDILTKNSVVQNGCLAREERDNPRIPSVGLIVRTRAGELAGDADELIYQFGRLSDDLDRLLQNALTRSCFSCLVAAPAPWEDVLGSLATPDEYQEIITDDVTLYEELSSYCAVHLSNKEVRLYQDKVLSLSKLYSLETRMESALKPKVWLKSGGYLVIEPTEALTVIDVNSGKNETGQGTDALRRLNHEAAVEIALQLRLRNLSGIILVDFINMEDPRDGRKLLEHLRDLVRQDRVKTTVVDITPLGLVEITRKKQKQPLLEQFH